MLAGFANLVATLQVALDMSNCYIDSITAVEATVSRTATGQMILIMPMAVEFGATRIPVSLHIPASR